MSAKIRQKSFLYTIGHSTRPIEEFILLLRTYQVQYLVDVRTIAKSRYNPQFGEEELHHSLKAAGIAYTHLLKLGGLRHAKKDSKNGGWRNKSFRGYADYMETEEFADGLAELEKIASEKTTAIMCAEAVPWRCHRSMIADALIVAGWEVFDIMTEKSAPKHKLTPFLKIKKGQITYPKATEEAPQEKLFE